MEIEVDTMRKGEENLVRETLERNPSGHKT